MNKPTIQHWVPRFYLKEFSIPETRNNYNPQVWVFRRDAGKPFNTGIKGITAERYLYSPERGDGSRCWKTEEDLARLETTLSSFWGAVAHDYIELGKEWVRKGLSLFLATLYLRNPIRIGEQTEIQAQLIAFYDTLPKDELGRPWISQIETKDGQLEFDTSDWFEYQYLTKVSQQHFFTQQIKKSAGEIAGLLMEKRWSIICSERPHFITTDSPVVLNNNLNRDKFGFGSKGTVITCPLSPTRVLILDDKYNEPNFQYYALPEDNPAPINLIHWIHADKYMISSRHTDEVLHEMVLYEDGFDKTL